MKQLHDRVVIQPRHKHELTREERSRTLNYLMFIKRKRCGRVKGRGCADGRKQRLYTEKQDTTSPTAMTESVFLTCVVDAHQKRDVATVDIPGALMQTDMDDDVAHIRLTGEMARLLVEIDPDTYTPFLCRERGDDVIYAKLLKALYGTLRAARMFYDLISSKFQEWGFVQNPYDPCVANKGIDGHQCTIVWHVDDLKISHVSKGVVDSVIDLLHKEFGTEDPLVVKRGPVHEYLGMTIDFSDVKKVKIDMKAYLEAMFEELPSTMGS